MPLWSMAAMVLAKVGAFLFSVIASISACSLLIPSLKAGRKCSLAILSNGGAWNGAVRAWKNGLSLATSPAADGNAASRRTVSNSGRVNRVLFSMVVIPPWESEIWL